MLDRITEHGIIFIYEVVEPHERAHELPLGQMIIFHREFYGLTDLSFGRITLELDHLRQPRDEHARMHHIQRTCTFLLPAELRAEGSMHSRFA